MLKRIITGAGYVAVMLIVFLLREEIDYRLFHILTMFITVIGTFEMSRAVSKWADENLSFISIVFSGLLVPIFLAVEYAFSPENGFKAVLIYLLVAVLLIAILYALKKYGFKKFIINVSPFLYPSFFTSFMLYANEMGINKGFIVLLLSFVIAPLSDTVAYFVGSLIGGKKLCPKLSPKKTWSGAIGGVIGGILGALAVFYLCKYRIYVKVESPLWFFIIIGGVASILGIFGDLFESFIKRRAGIKDSGKLLPGHGGVLDRLDSTFFIVVFLSIVFTFV